jgi:6-phosphogluconolactonase (cycloisomerase 2 family)
MRRQVFTGAALATVALAAFLGAPELQSIAVAQSQKAGAKPVLPVFEVDSHFPDMPDGLLLGGVGGATADSHGNVWVIHRPHTLEEGNATENGYKPAPPVVEFSPTGNYIQGWGGPSKDGQYQWFNRGGLHSAFAECANCTAERRTNGDGRPGSGEHGIAVDAHDNVWLTGNGDGDGHVLKFTKDGKFLLQIGKGGVGVDSNNTEHLSRPAGITVYDKTNEVFVADGYGNRRVVVFDANTGAYKRHWGAYGNKPDDKASKARQASGPGPQQFNTPHGIEVSNDGTVYVTDRANNRVQAFTLEGKFLKEGFIKRESGGTGTAFGVALSTDPAQRFLYIADGSNERIAILDRASLEEIGHIGRPGRKAGEFFHLHSLDVDPQGNLVTGESQGYRVQKFVFKGLSTAAK